MKRLALILAAAFLLALAAAPAQAFEIVDPEVQFTEADESPATQAGSHPFGITTTLAVDRVNIPEGENCITEEPTVSECEAPSGEIQQLKVVLPPGFVGNQTAVPKCSGADFATINKSLSQPACPDATAIGITGLQVEFDPVEAGRPFPYQYVPVYNLTPGPGAAAAFGFVVLGVPITTEVKVSQAFPYNLEARLHNTSQAILFYGAQLTVWGNPADPVHDPVRGHCLDAVNSIPAPVSLGNCPAGIEEEAFLTLPRSCEGPLTTTFEASPWEDQSILAKANAVSDEMEECELLEFEPELSAQPSTKAAETPTGAEVAIDVEDPGLLDPDDVAEADMSKAVVTLPEGMTLSASAGNGLEACSLAQFESATPKAPGCPSASKVGSVEVTTPLLEKTLAGSLYVAQQNDPASPGKENPFDSLFAVYMIIRDEELGVVIGQAGLVEPDKATGQITTTFSDIPQFPLSNIAVKFREGPRAPLVTPRTCATYTAHAVFTPSSGGPVHESDPTFTIEDACPPAVSPFAPAFNAGTLESQASSYSPFTMRITRQDGEADITRFDANLPPGVVAKIAGLGRCTEDQINAAKTKTGRQEQASSSCPESTQIGRVEAGAGLGSVLTYVSGKAYLAGPYGGAPLSVVVITPAVAGPFDLGNVVIREALNLNPQTARPEVSGAASDPIPRILEGIPVHVRDLRVYVDRPNFTTNATSCEPLSTEATLWGTGPGLALTPFGRSSYYQASGCKSLGFKPKISLSLIGKTKRAQHAALKSSVTYPYPSGPGYSNIGKAVVILPRSQQIDNAHVNNPCTREQFAQNACPKSSILGTAKATSPLLDEPLEGPVYFRSNGGVRLIPDIVADLHGLFHIELIGAVSTITPKTNPRLRTVFAGVPDAPVTKFTLNLYGGKRGLLVNNRNICKSKQKAQIKLTGQNGKLHNTEPVVKTSCKKGSAGGKGGK